MGRGWIGTYVPAALSLPRFKRRTLLRVLGSLFVLKLSMERAAATLFLPSAMYEMEKCFRTASTVLMVSRLGTKMMHWSSFGVSKTP
jgi:hypothetical protein